MPPSAAPLEARLTAIGVPVVVRSHGARAAELNDSVHDAWRDCRRSPSDQSEDLIVVDALLDDDETAVTTATTRGMVSSTCLDVVMDRLSPRITGEAITRNAGKLIMLHACGLADPRTGAAVALVAPSGTGKTTATRALGGQWTYLSDETVAIRPDRTVVPYPKPLSIVARHGDPTKQQRAASRMGLLTNGNTPHLVSIVLLDRDPRGPTCDVSPVPIVLALAGLAPQTSFLGFSEGPLQQLATLVKSVGGLRRVRYREAAALNDVVFDLIGGSS